MLLDVREDHEWQAGHAAEAVHLGKGILERDLEKLYPDANTEIIMYCGGGFRSALSCDAAQRMGYKNVHSLIGGYKGMVAAGWPMMKSNFVLFPATGELRMATPPTLSANTAGLHAVRHLRFEVVNFQSLNVRKASRRDANRSSRKFTLDVRQFQILGRGGQKCRRPAACRACSGSG